MIVKEIKKWGTGVEVLVDDNWYFINGVLDFKTKEDLKEKIKKAMEAQNAEISDADFNKFKMIEGVDINA